MEQGYKFTGKIAEDKGAMQKIFANCDDILQRDMTLGAEHGIDCFLLYIEITMSSVMFETTAIGQFLTRLSVMPENEIRRQLAENGQGLSDMVLYDTAEEAAAGLLTGDAILVIDARGHPGSPRYPLGGPAGDGQCGQPELHAGQRETGAQHA